MMYHGALMNLVALRLLIIFLSNVLVMIMKCCLLMLKDTIIIMMWKELNNLLLLRALMKLLLCLRMLMIRLPNLRAWLYLNIALRIIYADNYYITEYVKKVSPPKGETDALQEPMEDKIAETEISLDEKEEESEGQKEDLPYN